MYANKELLKSKFSLKNFLSEPFEIMKNIFSNL